MACIELHNFLVANTGLENQFFFGLKFNAFPYASDV